MTKTVAEAKPRKFASGITMHLGLVSLVVDLFPMQRGDDTGLKQICPECPKPTTVEQFYACSENKAHGPFKTGQLAKAKKTDDKLIPVTPDEITEIKELGFAKGEIDLRAYPAERVSAESWASGLSYTVYPAEKGGSPKGYTLLRTLVESMPDVAICGILNARGSAKLYRIAVREGRLVLQSMAFPDDLNPVLDTPTDAPDEKLVAQGQELVRQIIEDFNPEDLKNPRRAKLAEILDAKGDDAPVVAPTADNAPKPSKGEEELLAALAASVKATKKAKPKAKARA